MQARHHYEQAFEHFLRLKRMPYVAVNEARKALLPAVDGEDSLEALKSFDFVLYTPGVNLLVDIKGRKIGRPRRNAEPRPARGLLFPEPTRPPSTRLECWVTEDDVESLGTWQRLFGSEFKAALVFVYWCDQQPPAPLFEELFEFRSRWYAIRTVLLDDYTKAMKPRSPRWRTVHMPARDFDKACRPLCAWTGRGGDGTRDVAG